MLFIIFIRRSRHERDAGMVSLSKKQFCWAVSLGAHSEVKAAGNQLVLVAAL